MLCEFNEIIPKDCLSVETKKEYETRKLLELNELQSFFDNLGFDEDESNKLVKDTKKQYSTKYVEEDLPRMEKESWLNTPDPFATTQEKPIEQTG